MQENQHTDLMPNWLWAAVSLALAFLAVVCAGAPPIAAQARQTPEQASRPATQPLTLTEQVIRQVLEPLQRGIEEHSLPQVLDVFDPEETPDYTQFRDQMRAFFGQNESIRFRYKVLQVTAEKDKGSAMAEVDMAATPMDETKMAVQRSAQMSFQLRLGAKGWKLVGFTPGDFFTQ